MIASISAVVVAIAVGLLIRPIRGAVRRRARRDAAANLAFATAVTELTGNLQDVRIFGVEGPVGARLARASPRSA